MLLDSSNLFILDSIFFKIFLKVKILHVLQKSWVKQQKCQRIKLSAVTWSAAANTKIETGWCVRCVPRRFTNRFPIVVFQYRITVYTEGQLQPVQPVALSVVIQCPVVQPGKPVRNDTVRKLHQHCSGLNRQHVRYQLTY